MIFSKNTTRTLFGEKFPNLIGGFPSKIVLEKYLLIIKCGTSETVPDALAEGRCRRRLTRNTLGVSSSLNKLARTSSDLPSVELWSFCPEAIAEGNGGGDQRGLG